MRRMSRKRKYESDEALHFFHTHNYDGRAVLLYHEEPDSQGVPLPRLWLCMLNQTLTVCDDVGPDKDHHPDFGFVEAVNPKETVGDVKARWRAFRQSLVERRDFPRLGRPRLRYRGTLPTSVQ